MPSANRHPDRLVQRLVDREEIRDLMYRFSYFADTNQADRIQELFTEDAMLDAGYGRGGNSREEIFAYQSRRFSGADGNSVSETFQASSHHNANIIIEFEGPDEASVITSCYAWHRVAEQNPQAWGYYYDAVVRTDTGWRIKKRVLRIAGHDPFPGGSRFYPIAREHPNDHSTMPQMNRSRMW